VEKEQERDRLEKDGDAGRALGNYGPVSTHRGMLHRIKRTTEKKNSGNKSQRDEPRRLKKGDIELWPEKKQVCDTTTRIW